MCDVIKIRLSYKGGMRGEVGNDTPKKGMDFYDVTHDTLSFLINPPLSGSPKLITPLLGQRHYP